MSAIEIYNTKLGKKSVNDNLPQIFDFEGNQVRIIIDNNGEPWFVASDVTEVLGYRLTTNATRMLAEDEKGIRIVNTLGGPQKLAVVNESGVYAMIFVSRKQEAKMFRKWVTRDVLPTIRKTGGYGQQIDIKDPKQLLQILLESTEKVIELEYQQQVDQPKINFYDDFINSEGLYNLQNAARALNCHPNLFIDSLKSHYLFYQGAALVPYQKYRDQGLFIVKSNVIDNKARCQTYITPKGLKYFAEYAYCKAS